MQAIGKLTQLSKAVKNVEEFGILSRTTCILKNAAIGNLLVSLLVPRSCIVRHNQSLSTISVLLLML